MFVKWLLVAWLAFGALASVAMIGRPRKPIDHGQAMANVLVSAAWIVAIIIAWEA